MPKYRVTAVSYKCSDACIERDEHEMYVTEAETETAPQGSLWSIDDWWVQSGRTYRTPFMTGSVVDAI